MGLEEEAVEASAASPIARPINKDKMGPTKVAAEETGDVVGEEIGIDHDVTISILHFKLSLMYHQNNGEYWWVNVPPR